MWESIKILDIMAPNSTSAHMRDTIFQGHPPNTGPNALKTDPKTENYQVANQKFLLFSIQYMVFFVNNSHHRIEHASLAQW